MENKKIIIANWHTSKEIRGGQETYFYELSKMLNAKRISYWSCEKVLQKNLFKNLEHRPPIYQGYVIEEYLKSHETLFNLDLIIKNAGVGGYKDLKTPQIIVFQDPFYSIQKFFMNRGMFLEHFWRYNASIDLQRRTAKQGKTIAVSNFMKEDMRLNDIRCDKVIEEGIDIEKFKPVDNKEELKKRHKLPLDKKIGICVTRFIHQKGWMIMSELINKFPDIHWIVVLTESVGAKPKLKNVVLVEEADPSIMSKLYNCADFFINTSPIESFGLSPCEAASCNLPIITFKTGIFWDWFDSKIGYLVDDWSTESFTKAVRKIRDSDLKEFSPREVLIKRGLTKEVMEKNWKEFVKKTLNNKPT